MVPPRFALLCAVMLAPLSAAFGIILLDSADPARNTSTPGDNSGWQYEGQFGSVLGTPIAPRYFITAAHVGGEVGDPFYFHGETYTITADYPDAATDLRIWKVDHDFPAYAPLCQGGDVAGQDLRVFGRGTQRGAERSLGGRLRGWNWGMDDIVQRWGSNVINRTETSGDASYLVADFDSPGVPDEADLSRGDSGGGVFVLENGLWKLAAVNATVDDIYSAASDATQIVAALFDVRGYYAKDAQNHFFLIPDNGVNVPLSFYSTRVATRLGWIQSVIGQSAAVVPPESYAAWQHLYFAPAQIAAPDSAGPTADPDGDGVPNLLEFAFNLDPTFAEPAILAADTGLRGLPLVRTEKLGDDTTRLTVEYLRRTAASGAGIGYTVQWTSSLAPSELDWQAGGTASVVAINARWERVKVTDPVAPTGRSKSRFARVAVTVAPEVARAQASVK